ncbi:MAG TPA: MFS transporter [Ktedonobacteraceae bacterium]|nr:MFS transporter [Ktedonobacteraceae bacterium]
MEFIVRHSADFRKVNISLFLGGLVTFASMYCVQPLLPIFAHDFRVTPSVASLVLSVTTGILAVMITFASSFSNAWGRKSIMGASLFCTAAITIVSAWSPNFTILLICRSVEGCVLAGIPAIAMVYLGEEISPKHLGTAMGLYIGGCAFGGMLGRFITGILTDLFSWRIAMLGIGLIGIISSWYFLQNLPPSKHFVRQPFSAKQHIRGLGQQLKKPYLLCLYGIGFLLMGSFVTLYSYSGYQLIAPPYDLSQEMIGWLFSIYLLGMLGSSCMSGLANRWPRQQVLVFGIGLMLIGVLMTLNASLILKLLGIAFVTFSFFGSHAIASSWVSQQAAGGKAYASALYLCFYYIGSSVGNTSGGFFWSASGWTGVVGLISAFLLICLVLALVLPRLSAHQLSSEMEYVVERESSVSRMAVEESKV